MKYIVASGDGYYRRFVGDSPEMDSDPACGTRMSEDKANNVKDKMENLGFEAYLVPVREGRFLTQP